MRENDFIGIFSKIHGTRPFAADFERCGDRIVSMDSFSETEDFFTRTPPEIIGHDLAAGACSDLLAGGAKPEFLIQSWNLDDARQPEYYRAIAAGIEAALRHYGAKCIGGDLGSARPWLWCAAVVATSPDPVGRIAKRRVPFDLYISGPMGRTNLAVFRDAAMPELPLRDPVPADALFATDTSGGFFDALENFRRVNPGMRLTFETELAIAPEIPRGGAIDPVLFLIGGAGEYELVYAMPRGVPAPGIKVGAGDFADAPETLFAWTRNGAPGGSMKTPPPDYRDIAPENRLAATAEYLKEMMP